MAFNRNPFDESITGLLMKVYRITGDKAKAAKHLREYVRILSEELGIKPREDIIKIYASIK